MASKCTRVHARLSISVFSYAENQLEEETRVNLLETRKNFARKSVDQLGFIKDTNSLVALSGASYKNGHTSFAHAPSDSTVSLYALPALTPVTPLTQTRGAIVFALNSAVIHMLPDGRRPDPSDGPQSESRGIPSIITHLAVGCRKKIVIFSWRDGEAQGAKVSTASQAQAGPC